MAENVSGSDTTPQASRAGDAAFDAQRVCLRCDWTGETNSATCPECKAPLYRLAESKDSSEVIPSPLSRGPTAEPIPDPPAEVPAGADDVPPAGLGAVSRRRWAIAGAFAVAAGLLMVSTGWPFARQPPANEPPTASLSTDPLPTDRVLRHGNEIVSAEGSELVAMDPDTGQSRILLDVAVGIDPPPTAVGGEVISGQISAAAWSSDGRLVAFDGPDDALWVMNGEKDIRRLVSYVFGGWVWSPTEAKLAFIRDSTLTVVDAATGRLLDLGEVTGDVTSHPVWSPDGTRIVYGARGGSLYSVDARFGGHSLLARLPGEYLDSMDEIEWSPDGAHLAIVNDLAPGGGSLYVMGSDGSDLHILRRNYQPLGLAWSPDGDVLAYATHDPGDAARLLTVSPADRVPTTLATSAHISDPVWSPDGSRIAFAGTMKGPGWFVLDADGARPPLEIDELTYLSWRSAPILSSH
jgi:Tol biopolymer transport system component